MELQRNEIQHNTVSQIEGYLSEGKRICKDYGFEPTEHPDVFLKVVDLLAAKTIQSVQAPPVGFVPPNLGAGNRH